MKMNKADTTLHQSKGFRGRRESEDTEVLVYDSGKGLMLRLRVFCTHLKQGHDRLYPYAKNCPVNY